MIPALAPWLVAVSTMSFEACAPGPAAEPVCRVVAGTSPGAAVVYEVGGLTATARTLPLKGPLRFAVLGDSGTGSPAQLAVARSLESTDVSLVLHTGDIVYPKGAMSDYGPRYFEPYGRLLSRVPLYPAVGNHDYANQAIGARRARRRFDEVYRRIHRKPAYYSFDAGPVHFVSLDTNQSFWIDAAAAYGPGSPQDAWLREDLASSKAPWKVVFTHVPIHASEDHGDHDSLRRWLEPLLKKHGVQAVFTGHDHIYERSKPIEGTVFMTVGTGGAGLHTKRDRPDDPRFAARVAAHGFLHVEVDGDEMRLRFLDPEGRAHDAAVIRR